MKLLLQVVGLLLAVGAVVPAYFAYDAHLVVEGNQRELDFLENSKTGAYSTPSAAAEPREAEAKKNIESKSFERNLWAGLGVAAVVVGVGLAGLTSSKKRKKPAPTPETAAPPEVPLPPPA